MQLIPVWQPFGAPLTGILLLFSLAAPFETSQQPKAGRPTVPLVLTNVLICTSLNLIYQVNQWTMKGGGSIRVFWKQRLLGQQRRCAQTYICAAFRPQPQQNGFMLQKLRAWNHVITTYIYKYFIQHQEYYTWEKLTMWDRVVDVTMETPLLILTKQS